MKGTIANPVPLLALRELVVFPQQVVPLFVGREKSVRAIEESQKEGKYIMIDKSSTQFIFERFSKKLRGMDIIFVARSYFRHSAN